MNNKLLLGVTMLTACVSLKAATVTYVGVVHGASNSSGEIIQWNTSSVTKTFDIDGDNKYGTAGWIAFNGTSSYNLGSSTANFFNFVSAASQKKSTLVQVDTYGNIGHATNNSTGTSGYTLKFNSDHLNETIRVGVFYDIPEAGDTDSYTSAFNKAADHKLTATVTGGSSAVTPSAVFDDVVDMYFFDITGVQAGDTIVIVDTTSGSRGYVGSAFFDVVSIPEPSTYAFAGIGALMALGFATMRRRTK